jgi:osmotically-inducible protein OsmY
VTNSIRIKPKASTAEVESKIEGAFRRNADLDARRIGVEADDGKVTLRGSVSSWAEHDQATSAAWAAPGATSVDNRLTVVP